MSKKLSSKLLELSLVTEDPYFLLLSALAATDEKENRTAIFNLDDYDSMKCKKDFRFEKNDIYRLKEALALPDQMKTSNRMIFSGLEGLCILLKRLAYPNRYFDLQRTFGRGRSELSMICNAVLDFIYDKHGDLLVNLDNLWINEESLTVFSNAIAAKGSVLEKCFGFIDGTLRRTCRPKYNQQECYSGHKRTHGLKYQAVTTPNGIIYNLYGPIPARRHDSHMLNRSSFVENWSEHLRRLNCGPFYVYGDTGYPLKPLLITPHQGAHLTEDQQAFNNSMKQVRVTVEWEFGHIITQFAFLDFKKNQKIYLQPIGKQFFVSVIFKNCQTCLYGNKVSQYFDVEPPTLEEYLKAEVN